MPISRSLEFHTEIAKALLFGPNDIYLLQVVVSFCVDEAMIQVEVAWHDLSTNQRLFFFLLPLHTTNTIN